METVPFFKEEFHLFKCEGLLRSWEQLCSKKARGSSALKNAGGTGTTSACAAEACRGGTWAAGVVYTWPEPKEAVVLERLQEVTSSLWTLLPDKKEHFCSLEASGHPRPQFVLRRGPSND